MFIRHGKDLRKVRFSMQVVLKGQAVPVVDVYEGVGKTVSYALRLTC